MLKNENTGGITCQKCNATVASFNEVCPFCNTVLEQPNFPPNNLDDIKAEESIKENNLIDSLKKGRTIVLEKISKINFPNNIKKHITNIKTTISEMDKKTLKRYTIVVSSIFGVLALTISSVSIYNHIITKKFEDKKTELTELVVDEVTVYPLPEEDVKNIVPVNDSSSLYENSNFFMFQLTLDEKANKNIEKDSFYSMSTYIQKPNNILEYICVDGYGNVLTDKFDISITLKYKEKEQRKIDLLFLDKRDNIRRLENYIINGITFETYEATSDDYIKYFMVSDRMEETYLIYSIVFKDTSHFINNFNYLSHVVFTKEMKTKVEK